ncbi:hypothetical protein HYALB_00001368 [Hymenoscyphus albidus]|uniref:Cytochrome b-c1 complex subunit 6, mitochondrial n=1 Tax=Hymenoscyphus albidus TaxID=595503 RepID=A0A9N9LFS8_9HELO|nr:hypothetical protein HYALB_00001368 [Hymenoscyphus albidus]
MGFFSDLMEAVTPWAEVEAEAPAKEEEEEGVKDSRDEESEDKEEEEVEEEEEEEEMVDPKEKFEAECRESKGCSSYKHHFDECVERVTGKSDDGPKEDCVEEFFHLAHCANACAAPKVFAALK